MVVETFSQREVASHETRVLLRPLMRGRVTAFRRGFQATIIVLRPIPTSPSLKVVSKLTSIAIEACKPLIAVAAAVSLTTA